MIKKYIDFIKESQAPGESIPGSKKFHISEDEMRLFTTEPRLKKLIMDNKISLLDREVWYNEEDSETKSTLDTYLEMPGKNE
jgi:hypothetical protein